MTNWQPDLQLAAGNNNAAGLVAIQTITPTGAGQVFPPILNYGEYDRGERLTLADGSDFWRGYPAARWIFQVLPWLHARYLQETYCSNNYSGLVTVRLRTDDPDTYANFNAVMKLPKLIDLGRRRKVFIDYIVTFTKLEAI